MVIEHAIVRNQVIITIKYNMYIFYSQNICHERLNPFKF